MLKIVLAFFSLSLQISKAEAQIDVLHYKYQLALSDASDTLKGTAVITVKFLQNTKQFSLNLASVKGGKGMQVLNITSQQQTFSNVHSHDTLFINAENSFQKDSVQTFSITYAGIPADGLIISKNKYNERTFFADNWPDRAHQWIPCNDRPDDKATVAFEVIAPAQYKIISNGALLEEKALPQNLTVTHWAEKIPIPTKVMVIGAARFATKVFADSSVTPVSAWVYQKDSSIGFYDYSLATSIVKFFSGYIDMYPFEKLANVQSKTIFGGMENAGCIFYAENSVTGTRTSEALLAHEIAHQWFGNSVTEKSFAHVWLSEGFATYMTHMYLEKKYGRDTLMKRLEDDRNDVIQFAKSWPRPVVDSLSTGMDLLNVNSYQKGGWVLHMLRGEVGDSVFQKIIQTYYARFKSGNADTWDFEKVAEDVSNKDLEAFFEQWLYQPGLPLLSIQSTIDSGGLKLTIIQQHSLFHFPLEIGLVAKAGTMRKENIQIDQKETTVTFKISSIKNVLIDPDKKLLYAEVQR